MGVAIDPTCIKIDLNARNQTNASQMGGDLNAQNPTLYILTGAAGSIDTPKETIEEQAVGN